MLTAAFNSAWATTFSSSVESVDVNRMVTTQRSSNSHAWLARAIPSHSRIGQRFCGQDQDTFSISGCTATGAIASQTARADPAAPPHEFRGFSHFAMTSGRRMVGRDARSSRRPVARALFEPRDRVLAAAGPGANLHGAPAAADTGSRGEGEREAGRERSSWRQKRGARVSCVAGATRVRAASVGARTVRNRTANERRCRRASTDECSTDSDARPAPRRRVPWPVPAPRNRWARASSTLVQAQDSRTAC
jgi:hypothetical protein